MLSAPRAHEPSVDSAARTYKTRVWEAGSVPITVAPGTPLRKLGFFGCNLPPRGRLLPRCRTPPSGTQNDTWAATLLTPTDQEAEKRVLPVSTRGLS